MASRGYIALAFDPSFTGESGGEPRYMNSPDINTEDFMAAVDFLSTRENVVYSICKHNFSGVLQQFFFAGTVLVINLIFLANCFHPAFLHPDIH